MGWYSTRTERVTAWIFGQWRWRRQLGLCPGAKRAWKTVRLLPDLKRSRQGWLACGEVSLLEWDGDSYMGHPHDSTQGQPYHYSEEFRKRFPGVDRMFVFHIMRQGDRPTGGGPTFTIVVSAEARTLLAVYESEWVA